MGEREMTKRRLDLLLDKELDGDITALEREELERLVRMEAGARRDRESWKRFDASLKTSADSLPRIDRVRLLSRVMARRSSPMKPAASSIKSRAMLVGSSMLISALAIWSGVSARNKAKLPISGVVVTAVAADAGEPPLPTLASVGTPVEIRVGDLGSLDERDPSPVTIRF
jgi:hypothetical protein